MPTQRLALVTQTSLPITLKMQILTSRLITGWLVSYLLFFLTPSYGQQTPPIASPAGSSATQVLGTYSERNGYENGKWIQIFYGRPIKRERELFDLPDWRDALLDGAEVWRAGANVSTRLHTDVELSFAGTSVPPGEYTVFIDFGEGLDFEDWHLVISRWPAQLTYDYEDKTALWGAYEYTADRDVVRAPMTVSRDRIVYDQLSWQFANIHDGTGTLVLLWDDIQATANFSY